LNVSFPWKEFIRLGKLAIPLFIVGMSGLLISSMDRLVVTIFFGEEQIGYYGLAFLVNQSIYLLVTPIVEAINPRLMKSYGRHQEPKKSENYLNLLTFFMGSAIAFLISVVYLIIGDLLPLFLPQFEPAVRVTQILLIGSLFFALAIGANSFLIAINKQNQIINIQGIVIVLQAVLIGIIIRQGGSIEQVAIAAATSYVVYGTLSLIRTKISIGDTLRRTIGYWLKCVLPGIYVLLCAVLVSRWEPLNNGNVWLVALIHLAIWIVMIIPAGLYLSKELRQSIGKINRNRINN
jgi:O-antigen/teichoic acid export membrane protein